MRIAEDAADPPRRLLPLVFVERGGDHRVRLGRFELSQSTFNIAAALAIGAGGGFGAVGFRRLIDAISWLAVQRLAGSLSGSLGAASIIVPLVVGGAVVAALVSRFAPEAEGHGVPEVMAAVALFGGIIRPRVIVIKTLASAISIGVGGSCGREGPIVQIGSAIGSLVGQWFGAPAAILRTLVACGAAAGISATFNAPIGGVFFASEIILGEFAPRSFAAIVVSSVVAAVIGRTYLGNRPSFDAGAFTLVSPRELWLYAALGILCSLWAAFFVRGLYWVEDRFGSLRIHPIAKASIGFGIVGVIGTAFPQVLGVGYDRMQQVFDEHVPATHALALAVLKPVATWITIGSGGSGGIFSPTLFSGAMLGDAFGRVVHDVFPFWTGPPAAYGLVAMAAVFAAAAEAPITSIVIVFEMSNDYTIILPLMICTVVASLLGRRLIGGTVYELKLVRRGIDWARARHPGDLRLVRVSSVIRRPAVVADINDRIEQVAQSLQGSHESVVPVVERGQLTGMASAADIAIAVATGKGLAPISEIASSAGETLPPDATLEQAAALLAEAETVLVPVIDGDGQLLGDITRRDVLNAYRSSIDLLAEGATPSHTGQ
jgi:CIC family chloride channel protein